jgi:putative hemolysin
LDSIGLEAVLILILVIANGLFSMSEMAVVAARKSSLQQRAEQGSRRARIALDLSQNPDQFLSTIQIGITVIGTLAGAFGGLTIAEKLAAYLGRFPQIAAYAEGIGFGIVVVIISYLSLIIGELVPKRVALTSPERIASAVAPLMQKISRVASPVVRFLSWSTNLVFRLIPIKHSDEGAVTEEEIKSLIEQGTQAGIVKESEQDMVEGVFGLGDRRVIELMTSRLRVVWLEVSDTLDEILRTVRASQFSRFPVCEGSLDHVIGIVHVKDILPATAGLDGLDLRKIVREPLFVPETVNALKLLEMFRMTGAEAALVVDEHGGVEGLVTMADIIKAIVGALPEGGKALAQRAVQRDDCSWLVDGLLPISELEELIGKREIDPQDGSFTTVGGLVMAHLGRVPAIGTRSRQTRYSLKLSIWMENVWMKFWLKNCPNTERTRLPNEIRTTLRSTYGFCVVAWNLLLGPFFWPSHA